MQPQQPGDSPSPVYPAPRRWPIYTGTLVPAIWFPFIGWAIGLVLTLVQVNMAKKQNLSPQPYWEAFSISFLATLLITLVWIWSHS